MPDTDLRIEALYPDSNTLIDTSLGGSGNLLSNDAYRWSLQYDTTGTTIVATTIDTLTGILKNDTAFTEFSIAEPSNGDMINYGAMTVALEENLAKIAVSNSPTLKTMITCGLS